MTIKQSFAGPPFAPANRRRRVIPLASTAAALSLAGCAFQQPAPHAPVDSSTNAIMDQDDVVPSSMMSPQQRQAMIEVQNYTRGLNTALDQLDTQPRHDAAHPQSSASLAATPDLPASRPISSTPIATVTPLADRAVGIPTTLGASTAISAPPPALPSNSPPSTPGCAGARTHGRCFFPAQRAPPATQPAIAAALVPAAVSAAVPAAVPAPAVRVAAPVRAEPTISEALDVFRNRIAAHPTLNTALAFALLEASEGKSPDLSLAKSLSTPDQKLLADLLAALQGMTTPISASVSLPDRAAPLVDAAKRWQADADMTLPKIALASRVDSFGVYTPIEAKFTQGVKHTVILYCEVANFSSAKTADGFYDTRLSQQESLISHDGLLVYRPNAENVEDKSLNQRHDFYLVKKLTIPDTLAVGKYVLRMNVTDLTTNKIAIVSMPLEITDE